MNIFGDKMGVEIERKFLVIGNGYRKGCSGIFCKQGYLASEPNCTVRVRIIGDKGFLTVKGAVNGLFRTEYEYEIPVSDAEKMLDELCPKPLIEKHRYTVNISGLVWDIDEFHGQNEGLVIAEVNLHSESQQISLPDWVGREVSSDARYYNVNLAKNPYCRWQKK